MTIHTIGDSHAQFGWPSYVQTHWLGPILCYSIGTNPFLRCPIQSFGIQPNDYVVFCFGEIDCRCHIQKHVSERNNYQTIIDSLVEDYCQAIQLLSASLEIPVTTIVYNIVPPVKRENTVENKEYPYLGSDQERKEYVCYFNQRLQQVSKQYDIYYFLNYDMYADGDGFLNKELSDGNVHIQNPIYNDQLLNALIHEIHT